MAIATANHTGSVANLSSETRSYMSEPPFESMAAQEGIARYIRVHDRMGSFSLKHVFVEHPGWPVLDLHRRPPRRIRRLVFTAIGVSQPLRVRVSLGSEERWRHGDACRLAFLNEFLHQPNERIDPLDSFAAYHARHDALNAEPPTGR